MFATVFLGESDSGFVILMCAFAFVLPIVLLVVATLLWTLRSGSRTSLSTQPINPGVMVVLTLAWLSVSLVLVSDPEDENLVTFSLGLGYTLCLFAAWVVVLAAGIQTAISPGWRLQKRTVWVVWLVISLLTLPVAAWFLFYPVNEDELALKTRFELSDGALNGAIADRPAGNHRTGLFLVSSIQDLESCVFLETGGTALGDGLAYCPNGLPSRAMRDSPPDIQMSPLNGDWQTADWWRYEIYRGSY